MRLVPSASTQWQYRNTGQTGGTTDADIDAYEAWNTAGIKGSSSIKVAVLDTGIDPSHEDLTVSKVRNFTTDLNTSDLYGHGTHVAGSVAAKTNNGVGVSGTCPQCTLWNYKVLNNQGSGQWDWIANGIIGAADDGAHVISMSLGGYSPSQTLQAAVDYAWGSNWSSTPSTRQHAVVVAAAGNDGQNWGLYPAAYTNSIAVGATDSRDARASFSNFGGNWVDVAAPGASILSTAPKSASSIWPSGTTGYGTISGTSMATPHVSGLAGLVWSTSLCGAQDNACVRNRIESTADKIAGTGSGTSDFTTFGRINAYAAVVGSSSLLPTPTSTSIATLTPTPTQTSTPTIGPSPTSTATPPSVPAIDVTSISPSSMTAGGQPITVTIVGTGIQNGATVTFEQGSGNTPVASNVSVASDGKSLTARVSAGSGGPPRPRVWNVRVTNPGGASDVLTGAFTVNR